MRDVLVNDEFKRPTNFSKKQLTIYELFCRKFNCSAEETIY